MALLEVDGHRDASVIRETICKTLFHNDLLDGARRFAQNSSACGVARGFVDCRALTAEPGKG